MEDLGATLHDVTGSTAQFGEARFVTWRTIGQEAPDGPAQTIPTQ